MVITIIRVAHQYELGNLQRYRNSTSISCNNLEEFVCQAFFKAGIEVIPGDTKVSVLAIEKKQ